MRFRRFFLTFIVSLIIGGAIGLMGGWLLPFGQYSSSSIADLHPDFQAEYVVMVGQSYAINNDWDEVQSQLGKLDKPNTAGYVAQLAELYISEGRNPDDIRALVRLAAQYGVLTEPMRPYLPVSGS